MEQDRIKREAVNCLLERLSSFPQQNQLIPRLLTYIHIHVLYNWILDIHIYFHKHEYYI